MACYYMSEGQSTTVRCYDGQKLKLANLCVQTLTSSDMCEHTGQHNGLVEITPEG